MIQEHQIPDILQKTFPELNFELEKLPGTGNVYKTMGCFTDFTTRLIHAGKMTTVKECFHLAEKMLLGGNQVVKNAIENVFVYSLSSLMDMGDTAGREVKKLLQGPLQREYMRQVCASSK